MELELEGGFGGGAIAGDGGAGDGLKAAVDWGSKGRGRKFKKIIIFNYIFINYFFM